MDEVRLREPLRPELIQLQVQECMGIQEHPSVIVGTGVPRTRKMG